MGTKGGRRAGDLVETTMRYMHLCAAAPREAIRALEVRGDVGETDESGAKEVKRSG